MNEFDMRSLSGFGLPREVVVSTFHMYGIMEVVVSITITTLVPLPAPAPAAATSATRG
jgi:hypothetical protein